MSTAVEISTWADGPLAAYPLVLDKALDPYRKGSRKLVDVARHYGVSLTADDAHTSAGDCLAAARVAWVIAHRFPDQIGGTDLNDLMRYQVRAHARQAASFQDYLRRQGKPDVIDQSWPIRPLAVSS